MVDTISREPRQATNLVELALEVLDFVFEIDSKHVDVLQIFVANFFAFRFVRLIVREKRKHKRKRDEQTKPHFCAGCVQKWGREQQFNSSKDNCPKPGARLQTSSSLPLPPLQ